MKRAVGQTARKKNILILVGMFLAIFVLTFLVGKAFLGKQSNSDKTGEETKIEKLSETEAASFGAAGLSDDIVSEKKKSAEKKSTSVIKVGMAGDLCLAENSPVMKRLRQTGKGLSAGISSELLQRMREEDYMMINHEFSLSDRGTPMEGKAYTFCAPTKNVRYLQKMGVDGVSLANNHVYDFGKNAFLDTLSTLRNADIDYTGAGKNAKEAKKPLYVTMKKQGKKIAFVAATRAEKYIMTPEAGKSSPGVLRTYDNTQYLKVIRKAAEKADVVIAFVHWGTEYSTDLEAEQIQQAKDYIDAGADVVVGAHTHCLQGVGYYKGKPIVYSLGNFWFNEKTLYTALLEISIYPNNRVEAVMVPCIQKNYKTTMLKKQKHVKKFIQYVNGISTNARINRKGKITD